jgi:hypothetical protein
LKREVLLGLAYAVIALVLTAMFAREPAGLRHGNPRCEFLPMLDGTAARPYVYRALVPLSVSGLTRFVSDEQRAELRESLTEHHPVTRVLDNLVPGWERDAAPEYILCLGLIWLSLVGFAYSLRYLASGVYAAPLIVIQLLPFLAYFGLPPSFEPYGSYLYDFTVLFLFTLGLGLLVRRKWLPYLLLFLVSCINKETTVLLALIFFLHFLPKGRMPRGRFLQLLVVQGVIFLAVRTGLQMTYAQNPGDPVEFHLLRNIFKFPRYPIGFVVSSLVIIGFVLHDWRAKSAFLRTTFLMLVPLLGLTVFLGFLDELRDYYEVYAAGLLLMLPTLGGLFGIPIVQRKEPSEAQF